MTVTAARAAASGSIHNGGKAVRAESDHAVNVETIRVWRTTQRPFPARSNGGSSWTS